MKITLPVLSTRIRFYTEPCLIVACRFLHRKPPKGCVCVFRSPSEHFGDDHQLRPHCRGYVSHLVLYQLHRLSLDQLHMVPDGRIHGVERHRPDADCRASQLERQRLVHVPSPKPLGFPERYPFTHCP